MAKYYTDNEYHIPSLDTDYVIPVEESAPKEESPYMESSGAYDEYNEAVPALEAAAMAQEDNEDSGYRGAANRHEWLKKLFLRPVAALLIGVGVVTAGLGIDHLGLDYLRRDYLDTFPVLPNPDPDWEGKFDGGQNADKIARYYAKSIVEESKKYGEGEGEDYLALYQDIYQSVYNELKESYQGPELFLGYSLEEVDYNIHKNGVEYYLVKGSTWETYDPDTPLIEGPEDGSISYDSSTNTLTLNNFNGAFINTNVMGNAFKIRVLGENHVDLIRIWGARHSGSVTFTGNGKLTIGRQVDPEADYYEGGLWLGETIENYDEYGCACLMVDREVTLDIYGSPAVSIERTAMKEAIYYLKPITLTGGKPYLYDPYDEPGRHEHETPNCYYVTIVDDDGNPSSHVVFAPGN